MRKRMDRRGLRSTLLALAMAGGLSPLAASNEAEWDQPWKWDAGKITAEALEGGKLKGSFVERAIPAEWIASSGGIIAVELDMEVSGVDGADHKLQIQIKPPGETAYRPDDPGFLQIRLVAGKPTEISTLRTGESGERDSARVPALAPGSQLKVVFRFNLKDGSSRMDGSSGDKSFELNRNVPPQWDACASKGLILRMKPTDEGSGSLTLAIDARLSSSS